MKDREECPTQGMLVDITKEQASTIAKLEEEVAKLREAIDDYLLTENRADLNRALLGEPI